MKKQEMKKPVIAYLSFLLPALAILYGVFTVFSFERADSDWGLLSGFAGLIIAVFVGSVLSVIFSALSFLRKESIARSTLYLSLPSFCLIIWATWGYLNHSHDKKQKKLNTETMTYHKDRLLSREDLLINETWPNDNSPRGKALRGVLWKGLGRIDAADLKRLSEVDPTWNDTIYYHPACPEGMLHSGFSEYVKQHRSEGISAAFREILSHPKSPIDFVREVASWKELSEVDKYTIDRILTNKLKKN
jgi:hypothetical protein